MVEKEQPLKPDARAAIAGALCNLECWTIAYKDPENQPGVQPVRQEQVIPGTLVVLLNLRSNLEILYKCLSQIQFYLLNVYHKYSFIYSFFVNEISQ